MNAHMIDSSLFRDHYGTGEIRSVFTDEALLGKWIEVELALAQAEAELGVIPADTYEKIRSGSNRESFDMNLIREQMHATSHPLVAFIRQFEHNCPSGAGEYIHYGATTQDILDTAFILQLKDGYGVIVRQLNGLIATVRKLTERYRDTPMAGRTHGQHALPITFGFKTAVWLSELKRHANRLKRLEDGSFVGQLAGAAGTLASLGDKGLDVQRRMMEILGLDVPEICWHTSRDHLADIACAYGMVSATLAKIANEIINLQRTEIAEVEEGFVEGKVGSSTMPHKRNPMVSEYVTGLSRLVRNAASLSLECMIQEHERDMGLWLAEWAFLPEMSIYLSAMLERMHGVLAHLTVNADNMKHNLDATNGLILSERAMIFLAPYVGKQTAHELVYQASMAAFGQKTTLMEQLGKAEQIRQAVTLEQLERLFDPHQYLGLSTDFVDRVLKRTEMQV